MDRLSLVAIVHWILGYKGVSHLVSAVMSVVCMDERVKISRGYKAASAGPRLIDAKRSILAFLRLKMLEGQKVFILWATHGSGCGCSRIECEEHSLPLDAESIERRTHEMRLHEVKDFLDIPEIREGISTGKIFFFCGHCEMDESGEEMKGIRLYIKETKSLLEAAHLPPHDIDDIELVVNVPGAEIKLPDSNLICI